MKQERGFSEVSSKAPLASVLEWISDSVGVQRHRRRRVLVVGIRAGLHWRVGWIWRVGRFSVEVFLVRMVSVCAVSMVYPLGGWHLMIGFSLGAVS